MEPGMGEGMTTSVHREGFTLIEVMVAVAVIALVASVVLPKTYYLVDKAKLTRTRSELNSIKTALEAYYEEHKEFPPGGYYHSDSAKGDLNQWLADYIDREIEGDPWRGEYEYGYLPGDYCYIGSWGPDRERDSEPESSHTAEDDDIYLWLEF